MAFYLNGSRAPSNLYVLAMDSRKHRKLTAALNPAIDDEDLVQAEVVRYPSFDDLMLRLERTG